MGDRAITNGLRALREYLGSLPPGEVEKDRLLEVLVPAWPAIEGSEDRAMAAHKLGRIERPSWRVPVLEFDMERHGATVSGSTRAEVERWTVDVEAGTAEANDSGRRQLRPQAERLDVKLIAHELAEIIRGGDTDHRVERTERGVRVLTSEFLPVAVKQTAQGRRKQFYKALDAELDEAWTRSGNTYRRR